MKNKKLGMGLSSLLGARPDAEKKLTNEKNLFFTSIEQITRDANTMIQEHITETAIAAAIKLLEKKLNPDEKQNLINQSIKDFESVL